MIKLIMNSGNIFINGIPPVLSYSITLSKYQNSVFNVVLKIGLTLIQLLTVKKTY